uniref:Uncharacterized protein n=2 Tax=Candidatus Kentrum sp. MB TaxID=2138164 RepID=A0A451BBX1_9GAMM|nr:MAG: hypothetical protein BECKMB1821I_GA0114274_103134 [Candidatus Kentron sp. MB]VFK75786.1 MAG: hypothetical protein BECKMB1821H_GA0114242_103135 [Candidatus Kentron sp. MB]
MLVSLYSIVRERWPNEWIRRPGPVFGYFSVLRTNCFVPRFYPPEELARIALILRGQGLRRRNALGKDWIFMFAALLVV